MKLPESFTKVTPLSKYLALAMFVLLPFIGLIIGIKYQEFITPICPSNLVRDNSSNNNKNIPTIVEPTRSPITSQKALEELTKVINGEVVYEMSKNGIPTYIFFGDKGDFAVVSHLYIPGKSIFEDGYEGLKWQRNIATEISQFLSLKIGRQKAKFYAGIGEGHDTTITLKQLGNRKYAITDMFFKPSGSVIRYYYTYDEPSKQLIYIKYFISTFVSDITINDGEAKFPAEIEKFLLEQETEVLSSI